MQKLRAYTTISLSTKPPSCFIRNVLYHHLQSKKEKNKNPWAHLNGYLWHLVGIYKGCVWTAEMYMKYGIAIKNIIWQPLTEQSCVMQDCFVHHFQITQKNVEYCHGHWDATVYTALERPRHYLIKAIQLFFFLTVCPFHASKLITSIQN